MNIIEVEEESDEWYYRGRKILKTQKKQETIIKNNHNDPTIRHPEFKKIL